MAKNYIHYHEKAKKTLCDLTMDGKKVFAFKTWGAVTCPDCKAIKNLSYKNRD